MFLTWTYFWTVSVFDIFSPTNANKVIQQFKKGFLVWTLNLLFVILTCQRWARWTSSHVFSLVDRHYFRCWIYWIEEFMHFDLHIVIMVVAIILTLSCTQYVGVNAERKQIILTKVWQKSEKKTIIQELRMSFTCNQLHVDSKCMFCGGQSHILNSASSLKVLTVTLTLKELCETVKTIFEHVFASTAVIILSVFHPLYLIHEKQYRL